MKRRDTEYDIIRCFIMTCCCEMTSLKDVLKGTEHFMVAN